MKGKIWPGACLVLLALLLMSGSLADLREIRATAAAPEVPPGIKYYIPITITNSQASPTPSPFQQMVQVDSASYSTYEAPSLANEEFFDSSGRVIPSWLESGNSSTATSTTYWLRIADGIPASSNIVVYLGFTSTSTNLLNAETTGEAPQLSSSYGKYDDGASVFGFYDNFAGTSLKTVLWSENSASSGNSVTVDDGIKLSASSGRNDLPAIISVPGFTKPTVVEYYGLAEDGRGETYSVGGGGIGSDSIAANSLVYGTVNGLQGYWATTASGESFTGITTNPQSPGVHSMLLTGTSVTTEYDYLYLTSETSTVPSSETGNVIFVSQQDASSVVADWVRVRSYPPEGVMPAVSFGSLLPVASVAVSCSPSTAVLGPSTACTATVTGILPTGTVAWSTNGSGSFLPSTCNLSQGSCQSVYAPSTLSSPVSITVSYSGDSNNEPATGSFSLAVSKTGTFLTTTSVSCAPSPVATGSRTTCVATVAGSYPAGIVTWASSEGADFSPAPWCAVTGGVCSVNYTPSSPASQLTITATYSGDTDNAGSSATFSLSAIPVLPTQTSTSVTCSPSPVVVGTSSLCTVTVSGYSPTGVITWSSTGAGALSSSSCALAAGQCSVYFIPSAATPATISATYGGDSYNKGSSGTSSLPVSKASTVTSISCTPVTVNDGSPTQCQVTVKGDSPGGAVTFTSSSGTGTFAPSEQCTLSSGTCEVSYSDAVQGVPRITATYGGDSNNNGSLASTFITVSGSTSSFSQSSSPSSTSSTHTGVIPEFPDEISAAAIVATIVVIAYLILRRDMMQNKNQSKS